VLGGIAQRLTNAEIAEELTLSKRTVESYVSTLYVKLGVSTRAGLVRVAQQLALSEVSDGGPPQSPTAMRLSLRRWEQTLRHTQLQVAHNRQQLDRASAQVSRGYAQVEQARARTAAAWHFLATVAGMHYARLRDHTTPGEPALDGEAAPDSSG
jgi:hypothetical protein